MKINPLPHRLENKFLQKNDLAPYFHVNSLDELILALDHYRQEGYFDFEVIISPEFLKWVDNRKKVLLRNLPPLTPRLGFDFATTPRVHELTIPDSRIKSKQPLSKREITETISKLPEDTSVRFLQFMLVNVDWGKLTEHVAAQSHGKKDRPIEHRGLRVEGARVYFHDTPIPMSYRKAEVVRLLVRKKGAVCTYDDFFDSYNNIFLHDVLDKNATLRKKINEVRKLLRGVIGYDCIKNDSEVGYYLQIK